MVANTSPIFTVSADVSWPTTNPMVNAVTANTGAGVFDGTTASSLVIYTAGPNGSFVQKIILEPAGNNVASVLRIHVNNGSPNSTASNNSLIMQYSLPVTSTDNDSAIAHSEIPLMLQLPPGYRLLATFGAASTPLAGGWFVSVIAGDY